MHELGVVIQVVKSVEDFAKLNSVNEIDTLVLQVGELSAMIPRYIEACYPAAVEGTMLQNTKLKIEIIPGNGLCKKCDSVFNLLSNHNKCANCKSEEWELLSGTEFMIKEIIAC